jgi:hypothetical protein
VSLSADQIIDLTDVDQNPAAKSMGIAEIQDARDEHAMTSSTQTSSDDPPMDSEVADTMAMLQLMGVRGTDEQLMEQAEFEVRKRRENGHNNKKKRWFNFGRG